MKLLLLALLTFSANAQPPPRNFCYGPECVGRMAEIDRAFQNAQGIKDSFVPVLASGECYHLGRYHDSQKTQYGVVLLDTFEGKTYMGGRFSFFMEPNPYADWTLEKARAEFKSTIFAPEHELELNDTYAFANMNRGTEGDVIYYWLRRSGNYLLLEGFMGPFLSIFCELRKHNE